MTSLKPVKVFTHTDLDGVGSGLIFQAIYGKGNVDVTYCDYGRIDELIYKFLRTYTTEDFAKVFITDISVNEETAGMINSSGFAGLNRFILLDHHDTAKWLNKYDWALVQPIHSERPFHKSSGTSLIIDWFDNEEGYDIPNAVREFAEMVRKYDTWEWNTIYNDDTPKKYNDLMYMIGRENFVETMLFQIMAGTIEFTEVDKVLLAQKQKEIYKYIEKKNKQIIIRENEIDNLKFGLVFAEQYVSELGNELCKLHPEVDFVIIVDMGAKKISLRTVRDDIHLGELAKELGGGGHPKAAGAEFDEQKIFDFLGDLF